MPVAEATNPRSIVTDFAIISGAKYRFALMQFNFFICVLFLLYLT